MASARDVLRCATQDIHERLHGHIVFRRLLDRSITRDGYRTLLTRLYGFHRPLEVALSAHANVVPNLEMRRRARAHLLVADLRTLGLGDADIAALPLAAMPSRLEDRGRFLGCLYVREGAMLGGRVLADRLNDLLGPGRSGRRFFAGRDRDLALWRACCAALEAPAEAVHLEAMTAAARETFEVFESWINGLEIRAKGIRPARE
jgi:heme oxygenase (biliverdin-IX-beta and delta-forming)